jgi:hypothetical protein
MLKYLTKLFELFKFYTLKMDYSDSSKNIRKIINDLNQSILSKKEELRKNTLLLKDKFLNKNKESNLENNNLIKLYEELNEENSNLNNKKNLIKKNLEREEQELLKINKENLELENNIKELETINCKNVEIKRDLIEKLNKIRNLNANLKNKNRNLNSNELYKKYLGIELIKIKENVIKLEFNNFNSDSFVILDFTREDCVIECCPEINIERLNYLIKDKSFYEFVKYLREQFKAKEF